MWKLLKELWRKQDMQKMTRDQALEILKEQLAASLQSPEEPEHTHGPWRRGILPGQVYIKTCVMCGKWIVVTQQEWQDV